MTSAIPASHRDLLEAPTVGTLTTVGADGYPQSTAIWFLLDGDVIRTSLLTERQKYKNLVRHPRGTLFLVDPANPYRTLEVRADATVDDDPELRSWTGCSPTTARTEPRSRPRRTAAS